MPTELGSRASAAYGLAQEVSKQLITLSTAVFALTLTFADRIAKPGHGVRTLLDVSWVLYLLSIFFGIVVLMALAGQIEEPEMEPGPGGMQPADTINAPGIRVPAILQVLAFLAALVLTLVYGFGAV